MSANKKFSKAGITKIERRMMVDTTPRFVVSESKKHVPEKEYTRPTPPKKNN